MRHEVAGSETSNTPKMRFVGLAFLVVVIGLASWFWFKGGHAKPSMACVNREAILKLPQFKETAPAKTKDLLQEMNKTAAYLAWQHHYSVILDKKVVVSGVEDITPEMQSLLLSNKPLPSFPAPKVSSFVGTLDHNALITLPAFRDVQSRYSSLFLNSKLEFEKKSENLPPEQKQQLKSLYETELNAYRKKFISPLFDHLERMIKQVALEKNLLCVISQDDVLFGGTNITPDVIKKVETNGL